MKLVTSKNILIVDDLKINFLVVQKYLSQFSQIKLNFIQDPRDVIKYLESNSLPDLIMLDYEMPHLNGVEVCLEIKKNEKYRNIPIVFFTSMSAQETITNAFAAGAEDYLNKPVCEPELISRLSRIFQNQSLKLELASKYEDQAAMSRILSHDLNNYLSIFKASVSGLKRLTDPTNEQKTQFESITDRISRTVQRAEELVTSMRQIQALSDQKINLEVSSNSLLPIINESLMNFQEKIENKKLKIKFSENFESRLQKSSVLLEKVSALNSVIGNVLSNAVKFSHNDSQIDFDCYEKDNSFVLSIRDHGIGMPEELIQKVFLKNEKTTRMGTANESGTGFGMPLVKMYMEKYGGNVLVQSTTEDQNSNDHGTTIFLEFKKSA